MSDEPFGVTRVSGALGGLVNGLDLRQLDSATVDGLRAALLEHQVLFFRDQHLSVDQFESFVTQFGELDNHHFISKVEGSETVEHLSLEQNASPFVPPTSMYHIDVSMYEVPTKGAALYAVDVEEAGGDTIWVSTYAAYEGLSDPMKEFLEDRRGLFVALHPSALDAMVRAGPAAKDAAAGFLQKPSEHPLVHTHPETGRKALFYDAMFLWAILDLHPDENDALKRFLTRHISKPEFQCRFHWEPGSLAIWDNRCTMHKRVDDAHGQKREMHRLPLRGADWPRKQVAN